MDRPLDFTYAQDPQHGLYPAGWRWVKMSKEAGKLTQDEQSTVTECTFLPKLEDADFQLQFPVGCLVTDGLGPALTRYVVLSGGAKRPVLDEELKAGVPVEILMKTAPGEPLRQPSAGYRGWVVGGGLALGGVMILFAVLWRRLRSTAAGAK